MIRRLAAALAVIAPPAAAHPVDEVVQAAYLAIEPGRTRIELDITLGPRVANTVLHDLDRDRDQVISRDEAAAFAARVFGRCRLVIDGHALRWRFDQAGVPAYAALAQQADTLRLFGDAAAIREPGQHRLTFRNDYAPARGPVTANLFFPQRAGSQYRVYAQRRSDDGKLLAVEFSMSPAG